MILENRRWIFFVLMCTCLFRAGSCDKESLSHASHHPMSEEHYQNGHHNVEFDHEAVLGSEQANEEFAELPPHEAKKRLASMVDKMDTDNDGFVSAQELTDWIAKSFIELNKEEAQSKMQSQDINNDTIVTWMEYLRTVYGYGPEEVNEMEKDKNPEVQLFIRMVLDDKARFTKADINEDEKLDSDEYAAFLHPYDYLHMQEYELDRTLADYDKNNDKYIDFSEYLGESRGSREQQLVDKENFEYYDTNKDGQLDRAEIRAWIVPDLKNSATDEAEHLMSETDMNRDKKLTKQEILDQHLLWVGSTVTDYGSILHHHDPQEL